MPKNIISWTSLRRKAMRERTWRIVSTIVAISTILNVSFIGSLIAPKTVGAAGPASIWTTQATCANPADQDANEYANGDHVYVRGNNFVAGNTYYGTISGQPGNASSDPGEIVKTFQIVAADTAAHDGYFCVDAYIVGSDGDLDDGVYTVDIYDNANHQGSSKNDNYHVNALVGSLTINKVVDTGSASADSFIFEMTPDPYGVGQFSTTGGSIAFSNLPVGNYTVEEVDGPNNYHMVSNNCDVDVVNGQSVSCTVHNARDTQEVTIIKDVVGGTALPADWTFSLENDEASYTGIHSGDTVEVFTGTYALGEDGPAGYAMTGVDGNCYDDGGFFLYTNSDGGNTCTVTNTLVPTPSLAIRKTDNHVTAQPGETLTYEVTVTNDGGATAYGVQVDDTLPDFLSNPTNISDSGVFGSGHIVWNNLVVPSLDSITLTFDATIDAAMPVGITVLHNEAKLGCSPIQTDFLAVTCPFSGTAIDETSVTVVAPTLSIEKSNNIATFTNPGKTVTYSVTVSNNASATEDATDVVLTDVLPAGFTYVAGSGNPAPATVVGQTITWNLGDIAPDDSVTVTYQAKIDANQAAGTYTNTATATSENADQVSATSDVEVRVSELTIEKSNNVPTFTNPGHTVTYTVKVTNTGTAEATGVVLTDTLPAGFSFVTGSASTTPDSVVGQVITWNVGDLAASADFSVTYDATISADQAAGTYTNTAVADANRLDDVSATSDVEVRVPVVHGAATPHLLINKVASKTVVNPGNTLTYTVTVTNDGDGEALNVEVTDTLPAGFTFVVGGGSTKTFSLGTMQSEEVKTITYDVKVGATVTKGNYTNTAVATADDVDPATAHATVEVKVPAVLGLADTGASFRDYLVFMLGLLFVAFGAFGIRALRRQDQR